MGSISIEVCGENKEIVIRGNKEGLTELANQIFRVANSKIKGAHYHLDEASIADLAEVNVVFSLI